MRRRARVKIYDISEIATTQSTKRLNYVHQTRATSLNYGLCCFLCNGIAVYWSIGSELRCVSTTRIQTEVFPLVAFAFRVCSSLFPSSADHLAPLITSLYNTHLHCILPLIAVHEYCITSSVRSSVKSDPVSKPHVIGLWKLSNTVVELHEPSVPPHTALPRFWKHTHSCWLAYKLERTNTHIIARTCFCVG